ncbi:MAG: sirohydrochlorin chelatase [Thermoguttaceae bacterium]|jgi:sirohydrochlorin cobaltochelatase
MDDNYTGVLVIGHGMRDPSGTAAFLEIVDHVRQLLPETSVEGAFLEFAQPTITDGISRLANQGASHIAAVPMFLSALGHTSDDIPAAIAEAERRYQEGSGFRVQGSGFRGQDSDIEKHEKIIVSLKPHIGAHQRVVELSALRYRQALEGKKEIPAEETLLIIAAHGSPEPEAILELTAFARRRAVLTPIGNVEPCFAVLGQPQLGEVLPRAAQTQFKRIVVQPHLLLRGRFCDMIRDQVETFSREYPDKDWIVTEPLGPDRLLAQAVVEIVNTD